MLIFFIRELVAGSGEQLITFLIQFKLKLVLTTNICTFEICFLFDMYLKHLLFFFSVPSVEVGNMFARPKQKANVW